MTFFVLASVRKPPPTTGPPPPDVLMWLESWDGSQRVDLSSGPVRWRARSSGLGVPPVALSMASTPGVAGSSVSGVRTTARPVLLPLTVGGADWTATWDAIQQVRDLTDPAGAGPDGSFWLVASSPRGVRRLGLVYESGLEHDGTPSTVRQNPVIVATAPQPYASDREEQSRPYRLVQDTSPFLGGIWGQISIVSSVIADADTPVEMFSAVPVYPTVEVTGPAESVLITADNGLRIDVPDGLGSGDVLRVVTDPRRKSIRLNGDLAAGSLALGSRFAPFPLGVTPVSVVAPGATSDTRLELSWRGLHRGLW